MANPRSSHRFATFLALLAAAGALATVLGRARGPERPSLARYKAQAQRRDVRILRDTWGVPHVFGRTDADAAYGLAYAHAEDDFDTIQDALLAARGRLAAVKGGADAAANDYMVALFRVRETVEAGYETQLSPAVRAVCDAYADGLNLYAAEHPEKVRPFVFPLRGQDVVAGFVHKLPFFFGMDRTLRSLFGPSRRGAVAQKGAPAAAPASVSDAPPYGSNAFAVAPSRSADKATRLAINSHQPWDGVVAWYEAQVRSGEGWNMTGGTFAGAPVILLGHNDTLGWAHTVNQPDLTDVYVLETNPANENQYRFDGAWVELERRTVPIEVKLPGPFRWTFSREVLWSKHGPVVRQPHGTYAVRYAGQGDLRAVEQWFAMNKAQSKDAWDAAMRQQGIPMFNTVYADAAGNVGYVYNARLPKRDPAYDWASSLPGDTSETLPTSFLAYDELPQVWNPPSGLVLSANHSPFAATDGEGNPDPAAFPRSLGIERYQTNRARRLLELFTKDQAVTREAFDRYKFDAKYSAESNVAKRLRVLTEGPLPQNPLARAGVELLRRWDLGTDPQNPAAALALLVLRPRDNDQLPTISRDELVVRLEHAALALQERYGRLDVPFGEVHRLRRGTTDLPIDGGPDTIRAVYARPSPNDGRLVGWAGDSYVLLVEWDEAGRARSRSIQPYGSAMGDPRSPHHADQAPLFARGELRPVWRDEAEIRAHLEREYRPGE